MKKNRQILGTHFAFSLVVIGLAIAMLTLGSFFDWHVSNIVAHGSAFNDFVEDNAYMLSFVVVVFAGVCLFKGLKILNKPFLAWVALLAGVLVPLLN